MLAYLVDDEDTKDWKAYFVGVCEKSSGQKSLNSAPVINKLVEMLKDHKAIAAKARRPHLQTRFFETGDNVRGILSCIEMPLYLFVLLP